MATEDNLANLTLNEAEDGNQDVVDPWNVQSKNDTGIDYDKLIKRFGCQKISEELIARIEKVIGKPAHPLLKRGIFFSHRDLEFILDQKEAGKPFYLYT